MMRNENDFAVEVPPIKNAELKSATAYTCPACATNLNLYTAYGIEVEGCPNCKGIWLDRDELKKLKDKSEKWSWRTLRWMDDEVEAIEKSNFISSERVCPKCKEEQLVSTNFGNSDITIDWCPSCHGKWLDKDEFQRIMKHLHSELDKLSSGKMLNKIYEEIKEVWDGPEGRISEILDAKAAISALINITIFEHPKLSKLLIEFSKTARSIGL